MKQASYFQRISPLHINFEDANTASYEVSKDNSGFHFVALIRLAIYEIIFYFLIFHELSFKSTLMRYTLISMKMKALTASNF